MGGQVAAVHPVLVLFVPFFAEEVCRVQDRTEGDHACSITSRDTLPLLTSPKRGGGLPDLCRDPQMAFPGSLSVFSGVFSFFLIRQRLGTESPILIMPRGSHFRLLSV